MDLGPIVPPCSLVNRAHHPILAHPRCIDFCAINWAHHRKQAFGFASIALGRNSLTMSENSVALGADSMTDRDNTVSVGASRSWMRREKEHTS